MKYIKRFLGAIRYIFTSLGTIKRQSVDDGICDFSGQGRNKYGR